VTKEQLATVSAVERLEPVVGSWQTVEDATAMAMLRTAAVGEDRDDRNPRRRLSYTQN
jgi:hypothetical protein